jgi:molybdate transport system substrate-binding protein
MLLLAMMLSAASPDPTPLRVLAAGATESTIRAVASEYETRSGRRLQLTYGAVGLLRDRLLAGEEADLVIVTPAIIAQLDAKGLVRADPRADLGRLGGGLAVRAGAPRTSVGTPEELKQALLAADEIFIAAPETATAGAWFMSVAERLGISENVRPKLRTAPGGKEAMQRMARSTGRAIGATQISEILSVPEVSLIAPYPASLQQTTIYAGVVPVRAKEPAGAEEFLRFLTSEPVQERFRKAGFDR